MNEAKKDILVGFLVYAIEILLFYYLWKNNIALAIAFLLISFFILFWWADKFEKFLYFTGFILGPIGDITVVQAGIWTYGNPTLFGVPVWLPLGYGISTVTIVKIGKAIMMLVSK